MPARTRALRLCALADFPDARPGDDLAGLIVRAVDAMSLSIADGDVFVMAQKVVSKAEDRFVELRDVMPSARALELASITGKDGRLVEVILQESVRIVRAVRDVLVVEHRLGFVMANAGVDQSNVGPDGAGGVLRLPEDPDASAARLCEALQCRFERRVGVVINDSFGRAWRRGTTGVAIGAAGLPALMDLRGTPDRYGRTLRASLVAHADELAAAASLLMGQADEGQPVVLVQGLPESGQAARPARALLRPATEDLFR